MPVPALAAALVLLAASRYHELRLSARNERSMRARGGREAPGAAFGLFVALHTAFPLGLALEVLLGGARPGAFWPLWAVMWVAGEWLRFAAMRDLGDRWSARVYIVPGEPRVRRGLYRIFAHPNYLGVVLELAALPLLFGAWRTAVVAGISNALLLSARIRAERRALEAAERAPFDRAPRSE